MTEQLRKVLEDRLEEAEKNGSDPDIAAAKRAIDKALLECQVHTSERVKRIETDVIKIKGDVQDINEKIDGVTESQNTLVSQYQKTNTGLAAVQNEIKSWKDQAKGAKLLWDLLKIAAGAGGGAILLKALGA